MTCSHALLDSRRNKFRAWRTNIDGSRSMRRRSRAAEGASISDVRTEGGAGQEITQICRQRAYTLRTKREGGCQKIPKSCTGRMGWMAHRKWKEIKLQPSMLAGPAVPGSCLASFHFRWAIHPIRPVHVHVLNNL